MKIRKTSNKFAKLIYLLFGGILFCIGLVGILVPVLPGLLILLFAVFFFAKSSTRLNELFQKNKFYQMYFEQDAAE